MMELYNQLKKGAFFIIGPCVIESDELLDNIARELIRIKEKYNLTIIFKASFDKANRTSLESFRGPGLKNGLAMLKIIKDKYDLPITTDIHESYQVEQVGEIVDIIQIPAFLCRQTDLLTESAKTGKIVNIKKAQFLSGTDMFYATEKVRLSENNKILLTERGNMYGYNNIAVDFRNIIDMKNLGYPVIMDCTHSVQRPGGLGGQTGGNREYVPLMAKAAKAFGVDGYFFEVHPSPDNALSDGKNSLFLCDLENIIQSII